MLNLTLCPENKSNAVFFFLNLFQFCWQSLCNACGIRYRKKRRQELGLDHKQQQQQNNGEAKTEVKDSSSNSSSSGSSNLQVVQKRRLLMGVEEAAFLLMTLSSSPTSTWLHG